MTGELILHSIVTSEQGGPFVFCDIHPFTPASGNKINAMTSYVIDLSDGD